MLANFERFTEDGGAREVHGTEILWGSPHPHQEDYLSHARGVGWHLDRQRFDALFADACESAGVRVLRRTRVRDVQTQDKAHHLRLDGGDTICCRFVVDAAGRTAPIARRLGAQTIQVDRLVGFARFFTGATGDPRLTVEAIEDGWWYAAGLPGDRLVAVCLTDADLGRELGLHDADAWCRALRATTAIASRVGDAAAESDLIVRSAGSRQLEPAAAFEGLDDGQSLKAGSAGVPPAKGVKGVGWLAVGDAASVFDPLSSQGIVKSLRSGIFAAYAVGDHLMRGDDSGLTRYRRFIADEFASYLKIRADVYAEERRWPDRPFWRRRATP